MGTTGDLSGFTVGVTADRRGEDQAILLRRLGVHVVLGPTVQTLPVTEEAGLRARTEELIARPPDYLVANTGLGIRTWLAGAEKWGLDGQLRDALGQSRIAAPKLPAPCSSPASRCGGGPPANS